MGKSKNIIISLYSARDYKVFCGSDLTKLGVTEEHKQEKFASFPRDFMLDVEDHSKSGFVELTDSEKEDYRILSIYAVLERLKSKEEKPEKKEAPKPQKREKPETEEAPEPEAPESDEREIEEEPEPDKVPGPEEPESDEREIGEEPQSEEDTGPHPDNPKQEQKEPNTMRGEGDSEKPGAPSEMSGDKFKSFMDQAMSRGMQAPSRAYKHKFSDLLEEDKTNRHHASSNNEEPLMLAIKLLDKAHSRPSDSALYAQGMAALAKAAKKDPNMTIVEVVFLIIEKGLFLEK